MPKKQSANSRQKINGSTDESKSASVKEEIEEFQEITLFRNPIQTIYHLIAIIVGEIVNLISFLRRNFIIPILIFVYIVLFFIKEGPHREVSAF
jgi:hypothetical protein